MRSLLLLTGFCLLTACSTLEQTVLPTPLAPAQLAANAAVQIEDFTEDLEQDAKETTWIETIADALNGPLMMVQAEVTMVLTVVSFVGESVAYLVGITDTPPENRLKQIDAVIGPKPASAVPQGKTR